MLGYLEFFSECHYIYNLAVFYFTMLTTHLTSEMTVEMAVWRIEKC